MHILEKMENSEVFYLMRKSKFSLTLCSDLDYEGMVVDIKYGNDRIALAHYDKGIYDMEIQWLTTKKNETSNYPLNDLLETLKEAHDLLKKCALEDENHIPNRHNER